MRLLLFDKLLKVHFVHNKHELILLRMTDLLFNKMLQVRFKNYNDKINLLWMQDVHGTTILGSFSSEQGQKLRLLRRESKRLPQLCLWRQKHIVSKRHRQRSQQDNQLWLCLCSHRQQGHPLWLYLRSRHRSRGHCVCHQLWPWRDCLHHPLLFLFKPARLPKPLRAVRQKKLTTPL
jgi:hypothetical protein